MENIFPRHAPILPPSKEPAAKASETGTPTPWQQGRITRITTLTPEDAAAGLLWLAMNYPAACDAMLDKLDDDAIDDPDPAREPEPYCHQCGSHIGIFRRDDQHWQHYTGDVTIIGSIERFNPGHQPVLAWRPPRVPA